MNRLELLGFLALALLVGINLAGAVHELGHLAVGSAFGAQVVRFQPWQFLGNAQTAVSPLPDGLNALVAISGVMASGGVVLLLLLLLPWQRFRPRLALIAAVALAPCFHQFWPFLVCPFRTGRSDATHFVRSSGWNDVVVSLVAWVSIVALVWYWARRTQPLRHWSEAWSPNAET